MTSHRLAALILCAAASAAAAAPPDESWARVPPTPPEAAEATFCVLHGFQMQLVAAEPLVTDPVAMAFDESGRAYVAEMRDYPYTDRATDRPFEERTTDLPLGRIRLLEDTDGDGRFDKSCIFAEGLSWPTGLACWRGGIYVTATPDVWYLKDTDGDGRAEVRRRVYTGFRKFNVQAVMNNLKWGLDHRLYAAGGTNGGQVLHEGDPAAAAMVFAASDFRFSPLDERLELTPGGSRFGNAFDDWGNRFLCNIRNPVQHVVPLALGGSLRSVLPGAALVFDAAASGDQLRVFRKSPGEPWREVRARRLAAERNVAHPRSETVPDGFVTSSSGITIYRGSAYPAGFEGNVFVGEVAGNLVHRQRLAPRGVTFSSQRADDGAEFVASTDPWFRPVNFANAPDGTLYVLDMYRETIEHPWSIPDDIKERLDLVSGREFGRIYRLAPPGFTFLAVPDLSVATTHELVDFLAHPNAWCRETAHRLLFERQDASAVAPLRAMLRDDPRPLARLHALWSLDGLQALAHADLETGLTDVHAGLREHAVILARSRIGESLPLRRAVVALADDLELRVRFSVARALEDVEGADVARALAAIALRDAADPWVSAAAIGSAARRAGEMLRHVLTQAGAAGGACPEALLGKLVAEAIAEGGAGALASALEAVDQAEGADAAWLAAAERAVVLGAARGLARAGGSIAAWRESASEPDAARVDRVVAAATLDVKNHGNDEPVRLTAVEVLGFDARPETLSLLAGLFDPREPASVQMAAVRALSQSAGDSVTETLWSVFGRSTPAVRGEIIEAMFARPQRAASLVTALEQGVLTASQLPASRRALLVKHADQVVRERAEKLLADDVPRDRRAVFDEYREALALAADVDRGSAVFRRECLTCHRHGTLGHDVGPSLATIRHRAADEILLHLLDPNREVAPEFVEFTVVTADGRTARGIVAAETSSEVTLKRAEGVVEVIPRALIDELGSSGVSLMPEGLEKKVTPAEMADLIAFLTHGDLAP